MQIIPGILTDSIEELMRRLGLVAEAKRNGEPIEWVQIDFIDGEYADNLTLKPGEIAEVVSQFHSFIVSQQEELESKSRNFEIAKLIKFEAHLMVSKQNFHNSVQEVIEAGFDRIMLQIESLDMDQVEFVEWVKSEGREVGLSIDVQTSVSVIEKEIFKNLAVVQVMTVKTGFSGQGLILELLEKVRELVDLRAKDESLTFLIEVDGGVKLENVKMLQDLGVDLALVNSGLFGNTMKTLKSENTKSNEQAQQMFEENLKKFYKEIG